jgi:hypothetical protein
MMLIMPQVKQPMMMFWSSPVPHADNPMIRISAVAARLLAHYQARGHRGHRGRQKRYISVSWGIVLMQWL